MAKKSFLYAPLMAVLGAAAWTPASAQDAPVVEESEEIVVTANKREQNLADVPMSITAIGGEELDTLGADSIEDVQFRVPGLSLVNFGPGNGHQYQLRGISSNQGLPTAGVYLDEMPINSDIANGGLDVELSDLARVEVLRGPQGTLYGEGSMGGTIKYIPNAPNLHDFEGSLFGEVASVEDGSLNWRTRGVFDVPLIDGRLGVRGVISYDEVGGWVDRGAEEDVNSSTRLNVRLNALFEATPSTSVRLLYLHGDVDVDTDNFSQEGRVSTAPIATPAESQYDLLNLVLDQDLGFADLISSTGHIDRTSGSTIDLSTFFIPFLETPAPFGLGFPPGTFTGIGASGVNDTEIWTQELRLVSNGDGPLRWTLGGYYRDYSSRGLTDSFSEPVPVGFVLFGGDILQESSAWAAFGEVSYAITPRLEATVGGRYYEDDRSQDSTSISFGFPSAETNQASFDSFNPRFSLLYRFDSGSSVYANAAKGFRSGGFNLSSAGGGLPVPPSYAPENLWSYEIGGVWDVRPSDLLIQWAVYYNDWSDIQTFGFLPGSPFTVIVNGGAASGFGADLQVTYQPSEDVDLMFAAGWNDMEYDSTTADHLPGDPMDFVAPLTLASTINYRVPAWSTFGGYVRADLQYTDAFTVNIRNFLPAPVHSDERTLIRLSAGLDTDNWQAQVFVDNLLDEDAVTMPFYGSLSQPIRTLPRTIGVSVTRAF